MPLAHVYLEDVSVGKVSSQCTTNELKPRDLAIRKDTLDRNLTLSKIYAQILFKEYFLPSLSFDGGWFYPALLRIIFTAKTRHIKVCL